MLKITLDLDHSVSYRTGYQQFTLSVDKPILPTALLFVAFSMIPWAPLGKLVMSRSHRS